MYLAYWTGVRVSRRMPMMLRTLHRGYTLLELIVSVAVFSIIMLAATGSYLTLISLDREARAVGDVVTNLSFASDSMARTIRTGHDYRCEDVAGEAGANCTVTPGDSFGFDDGQSPSRHIVYTLEEGQVVVDIEGVASPITDPRVNVTSLNFYVRGVGLETGSEPEVQPQVTFTIKGEIDTGSATGDETVSFIIQNSATQRLLEL